MKTTIVVGTHGEAPKLLSWQEALTEAWERVHEDGWRIRVFGYRSTRDGRWHYTAVRAGRRRVTA